MRILVGHVYSEYSNNSPEQIAGWIDSLRRNGYEVGSFCLSHDVARPIAYWPELDRQWKTGDRLLLGMYEALAKKLDEYDVLLNFNGINLHPDFIGQLPTFNVYACFDDPESSDSLSKPVAWAYDLAMVGNIAEVETYRKWGVKQSQFWPLGFRDNDFDPNLTREQILSGEREVDIALLCERLTEWRKTRLDKFSAAFPGGAYYGPGWPKGLLPEEQRIPLMLRTKIGINIHNSTGPINFRTYYLPANGVLQICDNKSFLGEIFELNREVVGYDTIDEAIELTRFYLAHDDQRREIAANGWERVMKDYNQVAVFKRLVDAIAPLKSSKSKAETNAIAYVRTHGKRTLAVRTRDMFLAVPGLAGRTITRSLRSVYRWMEREYRDMRAGRKI